LLKTISSYCIGTHRVRNLLGTLFALVVADGLITNFLIAQGMGRELNPLLHILMAQGNFLMLKVVGAALSTFLLWYTYSKRPHISTTVIVGLVIIYTGIVYWNIFAYFVASV
jgi:hypothetical protein